MTWLTALFLGALQGVTEFLPVSSSGHLVLAQYFLGFSEEPTSVPMSAATVVGMMASPHGEGALLAPALIAASSHTSAQEIFFDGMLHLGTLLAVLAYFGKEITGHARRVLGGDTQGANAWPATWPQLVHLGILVGLATVPAAAMSLWKDEAIKESFKKPDAVATNFLILGAVLVTTDVIGRRWRGGTVGPATQWWQVLLIGCAQACSAIFRGLSRSGMTIGASLLVGLERTWAVRFSFLMSVVASLGLGTLGIRKALKDPSRDTWLTTEFLILTLAATLVSAVVGFLTITPLIRLVQRCQLWWFAVYVWLVGLAVLFFKLPIKDALDSALSR